MAACQGRGPSSGGQRDVAETPEQLVAHLESVSSEDVRAQLTALRRIAAVRNEDSWGCRRKCSRSPCVVAGLWLGPGLGKGKGTGGPQDPARLRQDGRLQRCLGRLEIRDVDARGFADLAWWCGRLAVQDGPLDSVNAVWSLGKLGCKDALLLHAPSEQVQGSLMSKALRTHPGPQRLLSGLTGLWWQPLQSRQLGLPLLQSLSAAAVAKVSKSDPQGLANIGQLEPQSPANVAWSWATSHIYGQALLNLICSRALAVLEEFQPLPLTNFVWSMAGLQTGGVPFPSSVSARVRKLVRQHNPQQAANSAWASGKAGYQDDQLLDMTREQAVGSGMNGPDSQKLANMAWAWATLVLRKMASFNAAAAASTRLVPEPRPQHCANMAWASTRAVLLPERLSGATATTFCQTVGEATAQELFNIA
ncbi:BPM1 [Symbiodinium sp. CCMP2592]|nr:BPM1 [Symbiodinium sp. CCMP2592]